jgi:hypothetical protein
LILHEKNDIDTTDSASIENANKHQSIPVSVLPKAAFVAYSLVLVDMDGCGAMDTSIVH